MSWFRRRPKEPETVLVEPKPIVVPPGHRAVFSLDHNVTADQVARFGQQIAKAWPGAVVTVGVDKVTVYHPHPSTTQEPA